MHSAYSLKLVDPCKVSAFKFIERRGKLKLFQLSEEESEYVKNGVTIIAARGQIELRKIIDQCFGVKKNPWCFVQNMNAAHWNQGCLSIDAVYWWKAYSAEPKIVAFKGCMPYGFRAVAQYDKEIFKKVNNYSEQQFIEHREDFYKQVLPWTDRFNKPYYELTADGELR